MRAKLSLHCTFVCLAAALVGGALRAADDANDPLVDAVVSLLGDKDKDMRAIGQQQVREQAKGPAATGRFVALLPKLPPDAQAGLLDALGARGDKTARPAVAEMLQSPNEPVAAAAAGALGLLGEAADVPPLVQSLATGGAAAKTAAQRSLEQMRAEDVDEKIMQALKAAKDPRQQTAIMQILERRQTRAAVPVLLELGLSDQAEVRAAAMQTLGQLAGPADIPKLVQSLLKAPSGPQRDAAEKAVMFVCERSKDAAGQGGPLVAVWQKLDDGQQIVLLPTLGRVGGRQALRVVEEAIASGAAARRDAGVRSLCNWPDASVTDRLLTLAQSSSDANHRLWATRALCRVAVLRDDRSEAERLDLLKKVMALASRGDERNLVIDRAKAIRTMDSLHFVLSCLDTPELTQRACATVVELAHYRELRDPNKAEFDKALSQVIARCKDAALVDQAKRYQRGETVEDRATTR